ncbi:MAG TPA: ATP-binding protein, partial [Thermoguttaceae bacterium]|nr:ATP-binding protein [Thermoguttaceae bacterium]
QLKDMDEKAFQTLLTQRRSTPPYCFRKVSLEAALSAEEARFVIADEGPGFDPHGLPDPTDAANLEKCSGRGILLMRSFMDEVRYNEKGNQVTLIKRFQPDPSRSPG